MWFGAHWSYGVTSCPLLIVCCFMILLHKAFHRMYSWTVFCLERLWAKESHPHISQVHQQDFSCHCYNSCQTESSQLSSGNQKKSNFKPLAANGKLYTKMECYNPENDWWSFVASTLNPLAKFSAWKFKSKIYIVRFTARDRDINILWYCPTSGPTVNSLISMVTDNRCSLLKK